LSLRWNRLLSRKRLGATGDASPAGIRTDFQRDFDRIALLPEAALVGVPDVAPHYQLVVERKGAMDHLTVEVEIAPALAATATAYPLIAQNVKHHIKSMIGVTTEVIVKQPNEIPRSQGKAVRVRDLRPRQA